MLTATDPEEATFDFLERIAFYVDAEGLPRQRIAWLDSIPNGQSRLALNVASDVELVPYVAAPEMTISAEASGVRPEQETTVQATATFDVDVNVL